MAWNITGKYTIFRTLFKFTFKAILARENIFYIYSARSEKIVA
jgi:hypothetical protein